MGHARWQHAAGAPLTTPIDLATLVETDDIRSTATALVTAADAVTEAWHRLAGALAGTVADDQGGDVRRSIRLMSDGSPGPFSVREDPSPLFELTEPELFRPGRAVEATDPYREQPVGRGRGRPAP